MMMSGLSLPADLVEEILSRVPAMSLKRLRSTCKQWNALFKDQTFTQKHFHKAAKQSLVLALKEFSVCSMIINLNVPAPSAEFKGGLGLKDPHSRSEQVDIFEVCHCDGLLLCTTTDKRPVVWNPCSGETKWIQPNYKILNRIWYLFTLGYQNNKSCPSYKILRYCVVINPSDPIVECEIYEFSSDTWRVLDDNNPNFFILKYGCVSLKGNTYWLASDYYDVGNFLLCFDFTTEKFKHLSLPSFQNLDHMALSVREEQLSVLHLHESMNTSKMEIWVTNKFDTEAALLWSKFFTVDSHIVGDWFPVPTSFLIDQEKREALCCNSGYQERRNKVYIIGEDDEYHKEIPYVESKSKDWWWLEIFSYVPSLVQIQQGRGQRKE